MIAWDGQWECWCKEAALKAGISIDELKKKLEANEAYLEISAGSASWRSAYNTIEPHIYMPDYQAMGDCRVCGHEQNKPWHIFRANEVTGGKMEESKNPWDYFNFHNINTEAIVRLREAKEHSSAMSWRAEMETLEYWIAWAAFADAISVAKLLEESK